MARNILAPVALSTYEAFCGWVDPSMPALNRFDFVTYLHSNFPDAERSVATSEAIKEYRATLREIVDTESVLVNLRTEVFHSQFGKELPSRRISTIYAAIDRDALDGAEEHASTALRKFEHSHLTLRLRKAELEFSILAAEAPEVERRLLTTSSLSPNGRKPFPMPEVKSRLTTLLANASTASASRSLSLLQMEPTSSPSAQQVEDSRNRAPSLSYSETSTVSSRPPATPHSSPRRARPVRAHVAHAPDTLPGKP